MRAPTDMGEVLGRRRLLVHAGRAPVHAAKDVSERRIVARLASLVVVCCMLALVALTPAATATTNGVMLNELNCTGADWIEVTNTSNVDVTVAGWLLTDDAVDLNPPRAAHRWRFPAGTVLAPGAHLVVNQDKAGVTGFSFGLSCGDDVLRLANATDTLVDSYALPNLASNTWTLGRIPDGTGNWTATMPTPGAVNAASTGEGLDDAPWLYDPKQVTEIDLETVHDPPAELYTAPTTYVPAKITIRNGTSTYGPIDVGLRLKGKGAFRTLDGKAAFKVKFGFSVAGQRFFGLKGLTLNNMVQDPSMISEATSALIVKALGLPTARVGYAYVRLNGHEYGLYADVENVDVVMAARLFAGTQHVYEADLYTTDVNLGREAEFQVDEGSTTDISDLLALSAANAGGTGTWFDRMQAVADMAEMTRTWAAEHYIGQWDGYSVADLDTTPNNYYLHSDLAGRFSMIISGTDQTWLDHTHFGVYGNGVMMRNCIADATCRALYVDALRQIAANPAITTIATQAGEIRDAIAPWRARDTRKEQSAAVGQAQANTEIATMAGRPSELAAWLASPSFFAATYYPWWGAPAPGAGGGAAATSDLSISGTVTPASSPVGGSHVWRLQVTNSGAGTASNAVVDVQLSPNIAYALSQVTHGPGCVPAGAGLHCLLDYLGPAGGTTATADIVIGTNVTAVGEVSLTATASFADADPTPADDTVVLKANTPVVAPLSPPLAVRPLLGKPVMVPAKPVAGKLGVFSVPVTRSDSGRLLMTGKMVCDPSVSGKVLRHTESFEAGKARLSFVVPKTAKGKLVKVKLTITASGQTVAHTYTYMVR